MRRTPAWSVGPGGATAPGGRGTGAAVRARGAAVDRGSQADSLPWPRSGAPSYPVALPVTPGAFKRVGRARGLGTVAGSPRSRTAAPRRRGSRGAAAPPPAAGAAAHGSFTSSPGGGQCAAPRRQSGWGRGSRERGGGGPLANHWLSAWGAAHTRASGSASHHQTGSAACPILKTPAVENWAPRRPQHSLCSI
jgi:hypothetical protein